MTTNAAEKPRHRYLATYEAASIYVPIERDEVYAHSEEEALVIAKRNYFHAKCGRAVHIHGPLHFSADHQGSTHGD